VTSNSGSGPSVEVLQHLSRLMDGYLSTQLLYIAVQAGIADCLAGGPLSTAEVVSATGLDSEGVARVLRGLALDGLLDEAEDGRFALTLAGQLLRSDVPASVRGAVLVRGDLYYRAAAGLLESTRTGVTAFDHVYGATCSGT
jgi:hypothetical protein